MNPFLSTSLFSLQDFVVDEGRVQGDSLWFAAMLLDSKSRCDDSLAFGSGCSLEMSSDAFLYLDLGTFSGVVNISLKADARKNLNISEK